MLWKKHLSIYTDSKPSSQSKKQYKKRGSLAPILPVASSNLQTIDSVNIVPTKFIVRKKSKAKQTINTSRNYYLVKGNNHLLVRRILQQFGLTQTLNKQMATLIWYQGQEIFKKDLSRKQLNPKLVNYLPNHFQITNKQKLYENLSSYDPSCIGKFIPKTYIIDFKDNLQKVQSALIDFMADFFTKNKIDKQPKRPTSFCVTNSFGQICILINRVFKKIHQNKKLHHSTIQYYSSNSSSSRQIIRSQQPYNTKQLWIVKPSSLNRGQGIQVINSLKQLQKILSQDPQQISMKLYQAQQKQHSYSYVIQQYINNPLLYNGYKFDIRVWIFLRKSRKYGPQVYIYRNGYVRIAGKKYINDNSTKYNLQGGPDTIQQTQNNKQRLSKSIQDLSTIKQNQHRNPSRGKKNPKNEKNVYDRYVHLTNNAVQKNCKQYGALHQGNQISIKQLIQSLAVPQLSEQYLFNRFSEITKFMIEAAKDKLFNSKCGYHNFQLMGLDFMLDTKYNVWLIQANCNPCLEQSSTLLKEWLPQMVREGLNISGISQKILNKNKQIISMSNENKNQPEQGQNINEFDKNEKIYQQKQTNLLKSTQDQQKIQFNINQQTCQSPQKTIKQQTQTKQNKKNNWIQII